MKTGAVRKTRYTALDLSRIKSTSFTKYHVIQMENEELERKLNPFAAYKELSNILHGSPENLTSFGRDKLLISVRNSQQSRLIHDVTSLYGTPCTVTAHKSMNQSKGLVFIREFDVSADELKEGLREQDVIEVQEAKWIRMQNTSVKPFLMTFSLELPPEHLKIPGEASTTRVS